MVATAELVCLFKSSWERGPCLCVCLCVRLSVHACVFVCVCLSLSRVAKKTYRAMKNLVLEGTYKDQAFCNITSVKLALQAEKRPNKVLSVCVCVSVCVFSVCMCVCLLRHVRLLLDRMASTPQKPKIHDCKCRACVHCTFNL